MEVKLKNKKLTTIGGSRGFIVDKAFIDNGQLDMDKEYDLTIVISTVNPILHECPMHRDKPLNKGEAEIQLKGKGVTK